MSTCAQCQAQVAATDRFCGSCGASQAEVSHVTIPRPVRGEQRSVRGLRNTAFTDGYCSACGHRRAAPDRDQADIGAVVLMTDRGIEHHRNEDAASAGVLTGSATGSALAVSDGVSSSEDAQLASGAAASAGVEAMLTALATTADGRASMLAGLAAATTAAAAAHSGTSTLTAPSCTYTAAVVLPGDDGSTRITIGNVGDSRAYWLPGSSSPAEQLTVDDSLSQELISTGLPPDSPAVLRGAHTITRWLGADSETQPWADSSVRTLTVTEAGLLLLCSDGLWNYLPGADDLAKFCAGKEPATAVRELVDFALAAGGQDNITVVVLPIGETS